MAIPLPPLNLNSTDQTSQTQSGGASGGGARTYIVGKQTFPTWAIVAALVLGLLLKKVK